MKIILKIIIVATLLVAAPIYASESNAKVKKIQNSDSKIIINNFDKEFPHECFRIIHNYEEFEKHSFCTNLTPNQTIFYFWVFLVKSVYDGYNLSKVNSLEELNRLEKMKDTNIKYVPDFKFPWGTYQAGKIDMPDAHCFIFKNQHIKKDNLTTSQNNAPEGRWLVYGYFCHPAIKGDNYANRMKGKFTDFLKRISLRGEFTGDMGPPTDKKRAETNPKGKAEREERPRESQDDGDKLYAISSGSGFSVSTDGLIVTNNHVVRGCSAVAVSDKGKIYEATVQSIDERNDLALLKSTLRPTHVFALNPDGTDILREIYVAGYPFGRMVSNSVKVTKGIVSSLVGLENNSSQIQIDAPLQVGNSGGPILDSEGRVVGVSVSKLDAFEVMKKKKQIPEGVGFGVKSETLIQVLKSSGVRTYKRGGLKTTDDIANAIRGGTFYISCLMTAERYKRFKGKKAMFEGINLD